MVKAAKSAEVNAVIDAVVISSILRKPAKSRKSKDGLETCLDVYVDTGVLMLWVDPDAGIIDEWKRTAGDEAVQVLVTRWMDAQGLQRVGCAGRIPARDARSLRELGFRDSGDKLIVRTAMAVECGRIVTDDSDFWDPGDKKSVGKEGSCVALLLRNELGVAVVTLKGLLSVLR